MIAAGKALGEFVAEATETLDVLGKDLLVLDERRGQEPDPELINFVKKNPNYRTTPLFIITTEGREQDRDRGMALGAAEYLVKPFHSESLEGLIRRYLNLEP